MAARSHQHIPWSVTAHAADGYQTREGTPEGHSQEGRWRGQRGNGHVPRAASSERGGRAGQDWLTGKLSLLGGRVGAMTGPGKKRADVPVQDAPGLGHVLPIPWLHRRPNDAAARPHAPGSVPNTRALGTLVLLANHPTAAAPAALARQARQARHCKVTRSARARLGPAGAALGTTGCGADGQRSPPQLCRRAGSPEAADYLPTPLAQPHPPS